uniref:IGF like family member 1 n=1 Tax=Sciurus vulgaris TaxID=55149 RepID=A0A8D2DY64_SCIVU
MTPRGCILAALAVLCLLMLLCSLGASSPTGASLMLCHPHTRCGDQFYHPLWHCCLQDALVPLGETRQCGNCSYRVCFEQCCPRPLVVKLMVDTCSSPLLAGDKLCHSVI